jgi:EmrB/QacA subfamily drug resistance transporter
MLGVNDQIRRWWILGATAGVLGLSVFDETIVGVALVKIRSDLAMSQVASHWVVNAYLLTFTCFVAIGGRLGDSFGHHGFFVAGTAIFGLASLASGFATTGGWLIAARAVQGIGTAIIFPAALAMTTSAFPLEQRGLALGIQTTMAAVFMSLGPLAGGVMTETLSWRWIFWINLPVVLAVALVALAAVVPTTSASDPAKAKSLGAIDYRGTATLIAGLSALIIALMQGAEWGWMTPATLTLFIAGVVLLTLFAAIETYATRPLIQIALLRIATFTGGDLVFFTFQFNKMAVFVFIALYLQEVLHKSPIVAGSAVFVGVLPTLVTSLLAGTSADRYGSRAPLMLALLINGLALISLGFATTLGSFVLIVALLVIWGATLPFLAIPARRALMNAIPAERRGQAGGVNLTIQMLGGTVGIALCGALLVTTGDYRSVFLMTGSLTIMTMVCVWYLVER